jgi:hypothetical protein
MRGKLWKVTEVMQLSWFRRSQPIAGN